MKFFFASLFMLFIHSNVLAHNVVGGVYATGADIEGEAGFSNGVMAHEGSLVKVSDQHGNPLGEVLTDAQGYFVFTAKKRITHVFDVNMGAGHSLTMQLPADELPDSLGAVSIPLNTSTLRTVKPTASDQVDASLAIERAVAKHIKPLRKEIQALKEKSGMRDIIGGIGYIFGLLGVVALLRERKLKAR